jgi:Glycosyltransferase
LSSVEEPGADGRVTILLFSAWGMGGTIRTTLNLAAYLAERYEVEIISVMRSRERPFFGAFPPGVKVTALDDKRPDAVRPAPTALTRRLLRMCPSVLVHPSERWAPWFSLWTDVRLARKLRGRSGFLIATRPGLNLIAAQVAAPGLITIGEEHMHLRHHARSLRKSMERLYPKLDAFTVLTEGTRREYEAILDGRPRLAVIPNSVRELGGRTADLEAKTVLAAGRLVSQKGFDYLIPAFAQVAAAHPDWRLRICGRGKLRKRLQGMIEDHGLADVVTLAPPADDMGAELDSASVFALSSRFEGFPLMLLEAMSKGMAVVSFDCPDGSADLIDDHRNGVLAPPRDAEALASACSRWSRTQSFAAVAPPRRSRPLAATGWRPSGPCGTTSCARSGRSGRPRRKGRNRVASATSPGRRAASARGGAGKALRVAPRHAHLQQGLGKVLGRRLWWLNSARLYLLGGVPEPGAVGPVVEVAVLEHSRLASDAEELTHSLRHGGGLAARSS